MLNKNSSYAFESLLTWNKVQQLIKSKLVSETVLYELKSSKNMQINPYRAITEVIMHWSFLLFSCMQYA